MWSHRVLADDESSWSCAPATSYTSMCQAFSQHTEPTETAVLKVYCRTSYYPSMSVICRPLVAGFVRDLCLTWLITIFFDDSLSTDASMFVPSVSTPAEIVCGVPQGTALGPILFLLYTADIPSLIEDHGLRIRRRHADIWILLIDCVTAASEHLWLILDVAAWMRSNRLNLNTVKIKILRSPVVISMNCLIHRSELAPTTLHRPPWFMTSRFFSIQTSPRGHTLQSLFLPALRCYVRYTNYEL